MIGLKAEIYFKGINLLYKNINRVYLDKNITIEIDPLRPSIFYVVDYLVQMLNQKFGIDMRQLGI